MSRETNPTKPRRQEDLGAALRERAAHRASEACLVVIHGEEIGRRIAVGTAVISIGRSSRCDLQLDEASVSRVHSRIEPTGEAGAWRVVDAGSTNGTYVNDATVRSRVLTHGDRIQIGRSILKFLVGGHVESAYHEEIYRMMSTDGLTGLASRRAFDEALAREFGRATRYNRPLSVILLDVDHFKRINDTYGHLAGDAVLRQVGELIRTNVRRDDTAARIGGEEFAIILPENDHAGAIRTAEKLRGLVAHHRYEFDRTTMALTLSAGLATRSPDDTEAIDLVRRADELLFQAKRAGRNCVRS